MAKIVASRINGDDRPAKRSGLVIGEHIFDDGESWPAIFEAAAGEDAQARLDAMIPEREPLRAANDILRMALAVEAAAALKVQDYVKQLPDKTLADAGFTLDEVAAVKK